MDTLEVLPPPLAAAMSAAGDAAFIENRIFDEITIGDSPRFSER